VPAPRAPGADRLRAIGPAGSAGPGPVRATGHGTWNDGPRQGRAGYPIYSPTCGNIATIRCMGALEERWSVTLGVIATRHQSRYFRPTTVADSRTDRGEDHLLSTEVKPLPTWAKPTVIHFCYYCDKRATFVVDGDNFCSTHAVNAHTEILRYLLRLAKG